MGREGATLGRRQTNTIAFSHDAGGSVMGIDASISGEHARIVYDEDGDFLHIMDGTPTKVQRAMYISCMHMYILRNCRRVREASAFDSSLCFTWRGI